MMTHIIMELLVFMAPAHLSAVGGYAFSKGSKCDCVKCVNASTLGVDFILKLVYSHAFFAVQFNLPHIETECYVFVLI